MSAADLEPQTVGVQTDATYYAQQRLLACEP